MEELYGRSATNRFNEKVRDDLLVWMDDENDKYAGGREFDLNNLPGAQDWRLEDPIDYDRDEEKASSKNKNSLGILKSIEKMTNLLKTRHDERVAEESNHGKRKTRTYEQEESKESDGSQDEIEDAFYRRELEIQQKWEEIESKILPRQYWRSERCTILKKDETQAYFEDEPLDEYSKLCYLIKLGEANTVRELAKDLEIISSTKLRKNGDTILHVCAEFGHVRLLKYFHKELECDLDVRNKLEETPFIVAAREGRILILRLFFEPPTLGAFNADAKTIDGWTAFNYACINGFKNTAEYLQKKRVNVHTTDKLKRTALHWAARFDNNEIVKMLL